MGRRLVLGDIHGAKTALEQVLDMCNYNPSDQVIFLGDWADGWGESIPTARLLREVDAVMVLGNHDQWAIDYLRFASAPPMWLDQGGKATLHSIVGHNLDEHLSAWLVTSWVPYHLTDDNRLFVHAGLPWDGHAEDFDVEDLIWTRSMASSAGIAHRRGSKKAISTVYDRVYIGHTSTYRWSQIPVLGGNVWMLDQGAGWEGRLSIMDIDTEEFWQSDVVSELYPDEKGRR